MSLECDVDCQKREIIIYHLSQDKRELKGVSPWNPARDRGTEKAGGKDHPLLGGIQTSYLLPERAADMISSTRLAKYDRRKRLLAPMCQVETKQGFS
jgi:hypothetical protein